MASKRKAQSKFLSGVSRVSDDGNRPAPPLDPMPPEWQPKAPKDGGDFISRFEAIIDPAFQLSDEAARRIEKQLRLTVLTEIAALDFLPEFRVATSPSRGVRGIAVTVVRE